MRLCRFAHDGGEKVAFYDDDSILPLEAAARFYSEATGEDVGGLASASIEACLPPDGNAYVRARAVADWVSNNDGSVSSSRISLSEAQLLVPIARPPKMFLLAGNYAAHIEEGGGVAVMRKETFPYVFMKPHTTFTHPGGVVKIPDVSPNHIDWECELGVVIGRKAKSVSEEDALQYVAGYMVVDDVSDRRFRPNPERKQREKDGFFDWLHGKWHDGFCVMGPCVTTADDIPDPQNLPLQLKVNGEIKQDANTSQQVVPVAGIVEFLSSFVTLEPGDVISTGTAAGVGSASNTFLKPGDQVEASIGGVGVLCHSMG